MPTNRVRRARKSQSVEDWKIEFMLHGRCLREDGRPRPKPYTWLPEYRGPFCNHWRGLWLELKDELMTQWKKDHRDGTLPWAARQMLGAE